MQNKGILKIRIIVFALIATLAITAYFIFDRGDNNGKEEVVKESKSNISESVPKISDNKGLTVGQMSQEQISASGSGQGLKNNMHLITIKTNYGEIQLQTYDADAPKTVQNFISLASKGFYDGVIFHRVIKGFMIQGGDPLGNGTGGPGYQFEDELNPGTDSYKSGYKKGVVAMANAGPNTNGSQFFIMLEDYPLPNNYTIFGKVVKGQEVVDAIGSAETGANDKPINPVVMEKVTVSELK